MKVKKYCLVIYIVIAFSFCVAGCSSTVIIDDEKNIDSQNNINENDYASEVESWTPETFVMGSVSHGIRHDDISELEVSGSIAYTGGELSIPYRVKTDGNATNLGFLLFVDGHPQAYHTTDSNENAYCHVFQLEDSVEKLFDFFFTPVSGNEGENVELTILSVYYPDFKPDMKETSSYGMYHHTLRVRCTINVMADPTIDVQKTMDTDIVKNIVQDEKDVTKEYLNGPISLEYGMQELTQELLDQDVYNVVLFDGEFHRDHILLSTNPLTVTLEMCGTDGVEYYVTPFIDHIPVSDAQTVTVQKGKVNMLSFVLDPMQIEDLSTFYFIAIPKNGEDFFQIKTASILLYKEGVR